MGNGVKSLEETDRREPASGNGSRLDTNRNIGQKNAEVLTDVRSKNGSKVNTPVLVESPDHSPREHETVSEKTETPSEKIEIKSTRTSQSNSPQGSRPESRMAHQNVQSPLGFRPPSTISEVS